MSESKIKSAPSPTPGSSSLALNISICAGAAIITFALLTGLGVIIMGSTLILGLLAFTGYLLTGQIRHIAKRRITIRTELFKEIAYSHSLLMELRVAETKARIAFTSSHHLTRISDSRTLVLATKFVEGLEAREAQLHDYATARSMIELEEGAAFAAAPLQLQGDAHSSLVFDDTGVKEVPRSVLPVFAENIVRELSMICARRAAASRAA